MDPAARIGFCCKWLDPLGLSAASMNQRDTTISSLMRLSPSMRMEKMAAIVSHNVAVLRRQLEWLSTQPPGMRLFRLTSRFVPASAHADFESIHAHHSFRTLLREGLAWVRPFADSHGIRLCMHPGQFTNLCSTRDEVVEQSIVDIEHHADLASLMGYGDGWHPSGFAINVHGNVSQDPGLRQFREVALGRLGYAARNLLTIENDEFSCGVDDLVESGVGQDVPMVLDLHHHWISSRGEHIAPSDPRIGAFRSSWRGVRPLSHASLSDEEVVAPWPADLLPDYTRLAERGLKPSALRKHSRLMWNRAALRWICSHLTWTDIEIEAKGKNLASMEAWGYAVGGR